MEGQMRIYRIPKIVRCLFPNVLFSIPTEQNEVFLTFDDGPHEIFTPQILDALDEHNAKATFFLLGEKLKPNKEIVRRILSAGHAIGIHGFNHISLLKLSKNKIHLQIENAKNELELITGKPVHLFRPAYGRFNPVVLKHCRLLSLRPVLWSFMSYDFDPKIPENNIILSSKRNIKAGDIIVYHDGHQFSYRTVNILPSVIMHLKSRGLTFSALS